MGDNLRTTSNFDEIVGILKSIQFSKSKVLIWQNIHGKRNLGNFKFAKVNASKKQFVLEAETDGDILEVNKEFSIYIRSDFFSLLCKTEIKIQRGREFLITIPHEIRVLEKRAYPRLTRKSLASKQIAMNIQGSAQSCVSFSFPIFDLSQTGISFKIPNKAADSFFPNTIIRITHIDEKKLEECITATIRFKSLMDQKTFNVKKEVYRLGAEFERHLTNEEFNLFILGVANDEKKAG